MTTLILGFLLIITITLLIAVAVIEYTDRTKPNPDREAIRRLIAEAKRKHRASRDLQRILCSATMQELRSEQRSPYFNIFRKRSV